MFCRGNASVLKKTNKKVIVWECRPLCLTGNLRRGKLSERNHLMFLFLLQYFQKWHTLLLYCDTLTLDEGRLKTEGSFFSSSSGCRPFYQPLHCFRQSYIFSYWQKQGAPINLLSPHGQDKLATFFRRKWRRVVASTFTSELHSHGSLVPIFKGQAATFLGICCLF